VADLTESKRQLEELIEACESVTGRSFDLGRLQETLENVNLMAADWSATLALNRAVPAPFNAMGDGLA